MLTWIEIDTAVLRHNYRLFVQQAAPAAVGPVLKSNAYGHGFDLTYQALAPEDPPWICTNYVFEAQRLRELGFQNRILVVGPSVPEEFSAAKKAQAEITIGNFDVLKAWQKSTDQPSFHLKIDTGMSRQGFLPEQVDQLIQVAQKDFSRVAGIAMHFANVEDVTRHDYAEVQLRRFQETSQKLAAAGLKCLRHSASSASTLLLKESCCDMVRVGISFYGLWPSQATRLSFRQEYNEVADLRPALSWYTQVTTVKPVKEGQFIGYGCTYKAIRDMTIAVLPVGYYEGYPRIAGNQGAHVLIDGHRCPIVGRICMNMMMVDVTHLANPKFGDLVTLIGTDGRETIAAEDLAGWSQTIHYELVTRLSLEIPRRQKSGSKSS